VFTATNNDRVHDFPPAGNSSRRAASFQAASDLLARGAWTAPPPAFDAEFTRPSRRVPRGIGLATQDAAAFATPEPTGTAIEPEARVHPAGRGTRCRGAPTTCRCPPLRTAFQNPTFIGYGQRIPSNSRANRHDCAATVPARTDPRSWDVVQHSRRSSTRSKRSPERTPRSCSSARRALAKNSSPRACTP